MQFLEHLAAEKSAMNTLDAKTNDKVSQTINNDFINIGDIVYNLL